MRGLALLLSIAACSGGPGVDAGSLPDDGGASDGGPHDGGSVPPADGGRLPIEVTWSPCTLQTTAALPAECAQVRAPLFWDRPLGPTLTLSVKRYRPPGVTPRGQLWLLSGGPGASVDSLDGAGPYF